MRSASCLVISIALSAMLGGCSERQIQARGFVLPAGNNMAGEQAFIELQCQQCHTVSGVVLDADVTMRDGPTLFELGGKVTRVKTYGELVTAIIHPSDYIAGPDKEMSRPDGSSWMTDYNDVMTVQQLIDIVEFLHERYQIVTPGYVYP
ncbi:MAG: cytochrome C [Pseudomonadota bacterium]